MEINTFETFERCSTNDILRWRHCQMCRVIVVYFVHLNLCDNVRNVVCCLA